MTSVEGTRSPRNPAPERAMHMMAKRDTPESRRLLYETLLTSTLLFQGRVSGGSQASDGQLIADANTRVVFGTIEYPPGNIILPTFTDVDALISFVGSTGQWLAIPAQALFQAIVPGNIAEVRINPFRSGQKISRPGGSVTRSEFTALAQGLLPGTMVSERVRGMTVGAGQEVIVMPVTTEPPAELLREISGYFRALPEVKAAYLFQMGSEGITSTAVGLEFGAALDSNHIEQILNGIGKIVAASLKNGTIDFMPLKRGPLLQTVRKRGRMLFSK